jgi:anti-anti-sigma regulatory factor
MDHRRFLIVDFEGVRFISDAAARELFGTLPRRWGMLVEA